LNRSLGLSNERLDGGFDRLVPQGTRAGFAHVLLRGETFLIRHVFEPPWTHTKQRSLGRPGSPRSGWTARPHSPDRLCRRYRPESTGIIAESSGPAQALVAGREARHTGRLHPRR